MSSELLFRSDAATLRAADLSGARLPGADLQEVDLTGVRLAGADLSWADLASAQMIGSDLGGALLRNATLSGAELAHANLVGANLENADLTGARLESAQLASARLARAALIDADLRSATLCSASLRHADLRRANLTHANLASASLDGALFLHTTLADCRHLSLASGLEEVHHLGPSFIDYRTLRANLHGLPDAFLHGLGLTRREIHAFRELYPEPGGYLACSIAHTADRADLAERLRADLTARSISCWGCPPPIGEHSWPDLADDIINAQENLIVLLDDGAPEDTWIQSTVEEALVREARARSERVFFVQVGEPVGIEEFFARADLTLLSLRRVDPQIAMADRQAVDLRGYPDPQAYQAALDTLIERMAHPARRRGSHWSEHPRYDRA